MPSLLQLLPHQRDLRIVRARLATPTKLQLFLPGPTLRHAPNTDPRRRVRGPAGDLLAADGLAGSAADRHLQLRRRLPAGEPARAAGVRGAHRLRARVPRDVSQGHGPRPGVLLRRGYQQLVQLG